LVITSQPSDASRAALQAAHLRSPFWLLIMTSLAVPAAAWGDIYKWTDERGRTVLSNVPPPASGKPRNLALLVKEARPAPAVPAHVATPTEQALLARIETLERQLQARQYAAQAPAVPPPASYGGYYPPMPPPPTVPAAGYYSSGYYSSYDTGYYYPSYYYPVVPAYSYAVYPVRPFVGRPLVVAPHGGAFHGGGHRGKR
jgi:hypothetical protein